MVDAVGPASYVDDPHAVSIGDLLPGRQGISPATAERIDAAVVGLLQGALARATSVLTANRGVLERCVRELLEREMLEEADLRRLAAELRRPDARTAALALA